MAKSTSNRTFHFFPRLPYELRILIWERAVRPRVVDIRSNRHFKDHPSFPTNPRSWSLDTSELVIMPLIPAPAVLHSCREARNHLTQPTRTRASGYYERVSVKCIVTPPRSEGEGQIEDDDPYTWVSFTVHWVDIASRRLTLSAHYASKIRRLRFAAPLGSQSAVEVLAPEKDEDCSPNVKKEVEIDCPDGIQAAVFPKFRDLRVKHWLRSMSPLLGSMECPLGYDTYELNLPHPPKCLRVPFLT